MDIAMIILITLFGATASFYTTAALILFLRCFYDAGIIWNRKKALILGALTVTEAVANLVFQENMIVSVLLMIAYCIIPVYDYSGNKFFAMLRFFRVYFLSVMAVGMAGMIGMYFVMPDYDLDSLETSASETLIHCILITLFFGGVFHYLHHRLGKENIFIPCGLRERAFGTVYTLIGFVLGVVIFVSGRDGRATLTIMACCIVLFGAAFPIFVYYARISEYYRERTRYQETYLQAELAHFQQYKQAQEETRRFRHDIRNNLLCMHEMMQSGKTAEAADYLRNLLETADTLSARYVSGDEILDCILSAKAEVMAQKGIAFRLDGVLAGGLPWKPIDVCSVFANALDNAIEACETLPAEQRQITMKLRATPQFWFVRIENPSARNVDVARLFQPRSGYTSKSNAGQHGIGTYNMKRTVENYGGMLKAECKERQFVLEFMIDKSGSSKKAA
ncbi:MAG: sensor histidine kinase [Ruminococcus sp.]|nr:sensor histidine kinase [Ruminococcus sp.]